MASAVSLRTDFSAVDLRRLTAVTRHANQSRRFLSLAAVQTLRDWVHRFNAHGPDGLRDSWSRGHAPRLSADEQGEFARLVESGPDRAVDGVVRWRRVDLQRVIGERFGVTYHERTVGKVLGFIHVGARSRHPTRDAGTVAAFSHLVTVSGSRWMSRMLPVSPPDRSGRCPSSPRWFLPGAPDASEVAGTSPRWMSDGNPPCWRAAGSRSAPSCCSATAARQPRSRSFRYEGHAAMSGRSIQDAVP